MIVVDTSAILALLQNESDAERFEDALAASEQSLMSAATALECAMVIEARYTPLGGARFDLLVKEAEIEIVAFDSEQLALARAAFRRFGRGRHPAALNFGDCFAYALSKHRGAPLLFKGDDFSQTDVSSAL